MSMYGHVTDAQVFSRDLTDQEMIDITNCRQVSVVSFSSDNVGVMKYLLAEICIDISIR